MKLTCIYVVGVLESIAQERGTIVVRISCNRKVKMYGEKELENPFKTKLYGEFSTKEITLSHSAAAFVEGDTVKLTRFFDDERENRFYLKNLSLAKLAKLDELALEKPDEELFSVEVKAFLEHIAKTKEGKVVLRLKCWEKTLVFFDENQDYREQKSAFDKTIYGVIPRDQLRLDICIDSLAAYKKGDKVRLSRLCDDGSFDLDNLTLSLDNEKTGYKTQWALRP